MSSTDNVVCVTYANSSEFISNLLEGENEEIKNFSNTFPDPARTPIRHLRTVPDLKIRYFENLLPCSPISKRKKILSMS